MMAKLLSTILLLHLLAVAVMAYVLWRMDARMMESYADHRPTIQTPAPGTIEP